VISNVGGIYSNHCGLNEWRCVAVTSRQLTHPVEAGRHEYLAVSVHNAHRVLGENCLQTEATRFSRSVHGILSENSRYWYRRATSGQNGLIGNG
jgi:hypothetical protein